MKKCSKCKELFSISEFCFQNKKLGKRHPSCYYCRLDAQLRCWYGISLTDYISMHIDQNKQCKICGKEESKPKRLYVDHCHKTGKVRGLLCSDCNTGLGSFKENKEALAKALEYLK